MLDFPNRTGVSYISPRQHNTCYTPFGSRLVTQETAFEVMTIAYLPTSAIALTVQSFDEKSLDANYNYSTESRTFASVEFFANGFYLGNGWLTKERQVVRPSMNGGTNWSWDNQSEATVLLAQVINAGFVPCTALMELQPDPEDPSPSIRLYSWIYHSYLIKPKKDVVIYIEAP